MKIRGYMIGVCLEALEPLGCSSVIKRIIYSTMPPINDCNIGSFVSVSGGAKARGRVPCEMLKGMLGSQQGIF